MNVTFEDGSKDDSVSLQDSRNYLKRLVIPKPDFIGVKIQARDGLVYNPCEPTRDEIRKKNFDRRYNQIRSKGFHAPNYKPYEGIGDPLNINENGLAYEEIPMKTKESIFETSQLETAAEKLRVKEAESKLVSKQSQPYRRPKSSANHLKDVLRRSEEVGKYVRIGHSYFGIIEKEKQHGAFLERQAKELAHFRARTEPQPPKAGSSSSDEDESPGEVNEEKRERKRQKFIPRPYTPVHCNICIPLPAHVEESTKMLWSLFRQLCCVYWFLQAMMQESDRMMAPITKSWDLKKNFGKVQLTKSEQDKIKRAKDRWAKFARPKQKHREKSTERHRGSWDYQASSRSDVESDYYTTDMDTSGDEESTSYDHSHSNFSYPASFTSTSIHTATTYKRSSRMNRSVRSRIRPGTAAPGLSSQTITSEADEGDDSRSFSEYQSGRTTATTRMEGNRERSKHLNALIRDHIASYRKKTPRSPINLPTDLDTRLLSRKNLTELARLVMTELDNQGSLYEESKAFHETVMMKRTTRVKSAPQFRSASQFKSDAQKQKIIDLRSKHEQCLEEKEIDVKDKIDNMARFRDQVCRGKLLGLPNKGAPHHAIQEMRSSSRYDVAIKEAQEFAKENEALRFAPWYNVLLYHLGQSVVKTKYIHQIMDKLRQVALIQTSKHTVAKFQKVLQGLSSWEVCHPDISAGLLFVRQRIVDMSDEEYDRWFTSAMPKGIGRPQMDNLEVMKAHIAKGGRVGEPAPGRPTTEDELTGDQMAKLKNGDGESEVENLLTVPKNMRVRPLTK